MKKLVVDSSMLWVEKVYSFRISDWEIDTGCIAYIYYLLRGPHSPQSCTQENLIRKFYLQAAKIEAGELKQQLVCLLVYSKLRWRRWSGMSRSRSTRIRSCRSEPCVRTRYLGHVARVEYVHVDVESCSCVPGHVWWALESWSWQLACNQLSPLSAFVIRLALHFLHR